MSTFKKVISIVLCIAMLAGSVSVLGGLATPEAKAAEGTSKIDSYESLAAAYDNFVYFGTEFYEIDIDVNADGTYGEASNHTLTDYYVDAGQILEARLYIKSDMYMGEGIFIMLYENDFFDVKQLTSALPGNPTTGYSQGQNGGVNTNHPAYKINGIKGQQTSGNTNTINWMKQRTGYSEAQLTAWDFSQTVTALTDNGQNQAYLFMVDEYIFSWYVKIKDGLADGETGSTYTMPGFWKCDDYDPTVTKQTTWNGRSGNFTVAVRPEDATPDDDYNFLMSATKNAFVNYGVYEHVLWDDLEHTFTVGENPNAGGGDTPSEPEGPVAGTSKIDSFDSLAAAYNNFVYFGTEFYEIDITVNDDGTYGEASNHILTDYYVDAGQILEARLYVKSDMYMGEGIFIMLYENDFFDVKQLTSALPGNPTTGYSQGQNGGVNTNHPAYKINGIKGQQTSGNTNTINWMKQRTGYTEAQLTAWDFSQTVTALTDNGQNQAYLFMVDEYIFSWYVKIKEGLADGETGSTYTMPGFWKCDDYDPTVTKQTTWNGRSGNFTVAVRPEGATPDDDYNFLMSATKNAFVNYGVYEHVLWDDLEHTFTIGENPDAGSGTVTKYAVKFLENDGTEISADEYAANAAVTVPAAVENQLGWADTTTGKLVDLEGYVATKKAEFKRVLTTDEFDITINLGGGTVDEAALPDNAKVEGGSLIVKAGLGEEVDLSTLPTPEKAGYTGEWNPATVTLDSIKGASASVKWTAKSYTVNFYNAKGDAEPIDTVTVAYNGTASTRNAVAPEGMKFAGWADAETDEIVAAPAGTATTASVKYTYDEDKSFYAVWTAYDSSITIMVRDYEAGSGWKVGAVSFNDAGKTLSKANTQALLEKAAASIDATIGTLPGTTMIYIYDNAETTGTLVDVTSGLKYNGATTYYLCTTLDFNVTWKVPVFDETTGTFSGYTETTSTASTGATANVYTVNVKTTADTTPPAGYVFKGWKLESTGEAVEYNANAGITLDSTFARDVAFVAEFAETEYTIAFDMQSGSADGKFTSDKTFKVGDAIDFEGATFTNGFDKETYLPTVGVENSEQTKPFIGMNGYKFTGWKIGTGANAVDVTFPVDELTYEMIAAYANGTTITVYGQWEAIEYELRFFYATPETDMSAAVADRTYAEPIVVKYKTGETINRDLDEETLAKINENSPEGYRFLQWSKLDGSVVDRKMPAYGLDLYASYTQQRILIYVDYNVDKFDADGNKLELKDTMKTTPFLTNNPVNYGDDIETLGDAEADIPMGVGTMVKRAIITEGDKPGEIYEVVSWNVYHVEEGKDIYDKNNWIPGINDEGTSNAYTTVIYQPEWKSHGEFLFRIYGTDGKIYMALGKNLKAYYWTNNYVSTRGEASVNHDPENLVVLLYKITIETEDGYTTRFDPIYAPKSMFTWDAFVGLLGALGNLLGSL